MCYNPINFTRIAKNAHNVHVETIFTILAAGEQILCNQPQTTHEQAVLVLGGTNYGRSIFTRWISNNDANFTSKLDMGEYIIMDPNRGINQFSPVTVPVLEFDRDTNIPYFSFPVFTDPADTVYDIAATYFSKEVMKHISSAKICFLVQHYKTTDPYQHELLYFLEYIIGLVKNIAKIEKSVLVVASNVPSAFSSAQEKEIIDAMVLSMQRLRHGLEQQNKGKNGTEYLKMMEFLKLFPNGTDSMYSKVSLFRSPDREGSLLNITLVQENRQSVRNKLTNLTFANAIGDNFEFLVNRHSLYDIGLVMSVIRTDIVNEIKIRCNEIHRYFADSETMTKNATLPMYLTQVQEKMESGYVKMSAVMSMVNAIADVKQCLSQIRDSAANVTNDVVKLDLSSALDNANALQFLNNINGFQRTEFSMCADGFANVIEYLDGSRRWYHFLKSLYNRLLIRNISKNMGTYNITNADINKTVSQTDLRVFLERNFRELLYLQYYEIQDVKLTEPKLEAVMRIANLMSGPIANLMLDSPAWDQLYLTNDPSNQVQKYLNDLQFPQNKFYNKSDRTYLPSYDHYRYDPNDPVDHNAANGIKSPINIAFNWLTSTSRCFSTFWIPYGMQFNVIKYRFLSIFAHSKSFDACSTEDYAGVAATGAKFNVFESLTLVDFLIRWMTKVKPYNNSVVESTDAIEIRAFVLNLVEQVENLIQFNLRNESVQFDALALTSRLEKELVINRNVSAISEVLYQSVKNANPNLDWSPLRDRIRQKVTKMVRTKT